MMVTIILLVSRPEYLERVLTSLELLICNRKQTNILCIVDGDDELFIKTRNHINGMKFNERLCVKSDVDELPVRLDIEKRRRHIAALHNQARKLIGEDVEYVLSVEDDTLIPADTIIKLKKIALENSAFGFAEGVELGRWGVPYVGAWRVDNIYDTRLIKSVEKGKGVEKIDAGGLYCSFIKAELYRNYEFHSENGLGPDVNFGLDLRRDGHDNFIHWQVPCEHYTDVMGKEIIITPDRETKVVTITKTIKNKWLVTY